MDKASEAGSVEFIKMGTEIKRLDSSGASKAKMPEIVEERVVDLGSDEESFVFSEESKVHD